MSLTSTPIPISEPGLAQPRLARPLAALTIAGSDSGGGAGIQADSRTFTAHGLLATTAITAITAQNTLGVQSWEAVSSKLVAAQIDSVLSDLPVGAIKSGMLGTSDVIEAVATSLSTTSLPYVLDPVMVSTSGHRLLQKDAEDALRYRLVPLAHVLTPNLPEASVLAGLDTERDPERLAEVLVKLAPKAFIVIKGGHAERGISAKDLVILPTGEQRWLEAEWLDTRSTHGTGCSFSAAICANLALGLEPFEAIVKARAWLARAMRHAMPYGAGHGPVDHLAGLRAEL